MGFNCSCLLALKVIIFVNHPIFTCLHSKKASHIHDYKFTISNIINFSTQCKTNEESWLSFATI